ncbi:MAG: ABC transporter substrate-binding protein, partial [Anaerolineaceae bacterium]
MRAVACTALISLSLLYVSCGSEKPSTGPRPSPTATVEAQVTLGNRSVTDMVGRALRVPDSLSRVVAITPSAADFAAALGLDVVGRSTDAAAPAVAAAPTVGSSLAPDFNAIAALKPDLVIGDAAFDGARLRDFERFAYPVFLLKVSSYDDVLLALVALGDAIGRTQQGRDAAAAIEIGVADLVRPLARNVPPTVIILTGSGREVYAGSDQTYIGSLV